MQIVRIGGDYSTVPDVAIETLKSMEDENGIIRTSYDHYHNGEKVRFKEGHKLALYEGLIKVSRKKRIFVVLELMGRIQEIPATTNDIEAV